MSYTLENMPVKSNVKPSVRTDVVSDPLVNIREGLARRATAAAAQPSVSTTPTSTATTVAQISCPQGQTSYYGQCYDTKKLELAKTLTAIVCLTSSVVSGFHGYRRNQSVGWAIIWFVLGGIFPVVTPVIALAQGYGKPRVSLRQPASVVGGN